MWLAGTMTRSASRDSSAAVLAPADAQFRVTDWGALAERIQQTRRGMIRRALTVKYCDPRLPFAQRSDKRPGIVHARALGEQGRQAACTLDQPTASTTMS